MTKQIRPSAITHIIQEYIQHLPTPKDPDCKCGWYSVQSICGHPYGFPGHKHTCGQTRSPYGKLVFCKEVRNPSAPHITVPGVCCNVNCPRCRKETLRKKEQSAVEEYL